MKIKTKTPITDFRGNSILLDEESTQPDGKVARVARPMTLADAVGTALSAHVQGDNVEPKAAYERQKLARAFWSEEEVDLTTADAALIQRLAAKVMVPGIAGAVYELIEGAAGAG